MYAILLLAVLSQLDDLNMGGPALSLNMGRASVQDLPNLRLYAPDWCPHCPKAKSEVMGYLTTRYNVIIHSNSHEFPEWVNARSQEPGWGFPMVHWNDGRESYVMAWPGIESFLKQESKVDASAAPTPGREVERVIGLLPKPEVGFVDWGCGDARWCIAAAERWGCRVTGVEIDPARAAFARERVRAVGLSHLITIIEGDATKIDVQADIGVAYLYPDVLEQLRPRIEKLRAFASYMHRPAGLPVVKNGDAWLYVKPTQAAVLQYPMAVWGGYSYSQRICNSPNCAMCNAIQRQLSRSR